MTAYVFRDASGHEERPEAQRWMDSEDGVVAASIALALLPPESRARVVKVLHLCQLPVCVCYVVLCVVSVFRSSPMAQLVFAGSVILNP